MSIAQFDGENWTKTIIIPKRPFYTVADTATILNTGVAAIYQKIDRRTMKAFKVEKIIMIKHEDLIEYIARRQALANYDFSQLSIEGAS